jgi:predicted esterase
VTCNGNYKSTSWFDIIDIPVTESEPDDPVGIDASLSTIHGILDDIISTHNIPSSKVFLGGFSQGGAMSLLAGSTYSQPLGGVLCLSGWLLRGDVNVNNWGTGMKGTPVFIGHGTADNVVLPSLGAVAANRIKDARGIAGETCGSDDVGEVVFKTYRGEGHGACPDEMRDVQEFFGKYIKP